MNGISKFDDKTPRPVRKIDSDSPVMPGMDDFDFTDAELADADPATGVIQWAAPYRFPHGPTRGLCWDSGSLGDQFANTSLGFLDDTGQLLAFNDANESAPREGDTASRFVKAHFRFYYRHLDRAGRLKVTATFDVRRARIQDRAIGEEPAIELLDFQNLRIAAYCQSGEYWDQFGKAIDTFHELEWKNGSEIQSYDFDKGDVRRTVTMTSDSELSPGQLCKFYVGIWTGLSLRTAATGYSTFNEFDVKLEQVNAELL